MAQRENLEIQTVQGDMTDLSCFADDTFDLIFNAVSNCFIEDVKPLWNECYRVLRRGGILIAGFSITGFFEDNNGGKDPLDAYIPIFIATRASK